MSTESADPFPSRSHPIERTMRQVAAVLSLVKLIFGMGAVCVIAIGGAFVWINKTSAAIDETKRAVADINASQQNSWVWRSETDRAITKLTTLMEQQAETNRRLELLVRQRGP